MSKQPRAGYYGDFGGCFLPEGLIAPIQELTHHWQQLSSSPVFQQKFRSLLADYAGRPTPLTPVHRFSEAINGPRIFLKREDLLHTGAHKLNNALGQCLLALAMGKKRIVAETGAGQHGVACATACARLGLECVIYMGATDMQRQAPNVERMYLLGAKVVAVQQGRQTLKDAVNEALRDWSLNFEDTHYCLGSALGPHPYPQMVAAFQQVIGEETYRQCRNQIGKNPHLIIACIGGGSNAIGIFKRFLSETEVALIGVEAGGIGNQPGQHAARFQDLKPGVIHGCYTYLLQDEQGQIADTQSIAAGLDYPAVGPEHAALFASGRVSYTSVNDQQAVHAQRLLAQTEGIIPALESSHALAYMINIATDFAKDSVVVINLSGRGDKDLRQIILEEKVNESNN